MSVRTATLAFCAALALAATAGAHEPGGHSGEGAPHAHDAPRPAAAHAHGEGAAKGHAHGAGDEHGHAHGTDPVPGSTSGFVDAFARGDVDAIAARHPEDGELLPPNAPRQRGHQAIAAYYKGAIDAGLKIELEETRQQFGGAIGYKTGDYVVRAADGTQLDRGKWLEVWELRGDGWYLVSDIWNSDLPAPAPAG